MLQLRLAGMAGGIPAKEIGLGAGGLVKTGLLIGDMDSSTFEGDVTDGGLLLTKLPFEGDKTKGSSSASVNI